MSRDELLVLAGQWRFSQSRTRALASRLTSSEAVARERVMAAELSKKYSRQSTLGWQILVAGCVGAVLGFLAVALRGYAPVGVAALGAIAIAAGLGLVVGGIGLGCTASDKFAEAEATLADLTPVVKSDACKTALGFVAGGHPAVLAWRDLAIAERGVLCAFDVQLMRELHYASEAAADAGAQQRENELACRQLYGIADEDTLPAVMVEA